MLFDILSLTRLNETNVRHQNGDPSEQAESDDEMVDMFENVVPFFDHIEKRNADEQRR